MGYKYHTHRKLLYVLDYLHSIEDGGYELRQVRLGRLTWAKESTTVKGYPVRPWGVRVEWQPVRTTTQITGEVDYEVRSSWLITITTANHTSALHWNKKHTVVLRTV